METSAQSVTIANVVIIPTRDGWELRPTLSAAQLQLALFTLMAGLCLTGAIFFWRLADEVARYFFALPIFLFAMQLFVRGFWGWCLRNRPLVVESGGRVCYGPRELCATGSVESVRLVPDPRSEADGHKVNLLLATGVVIELPAPYFDSFLTRERARVFAVQFTRLLDVGVVDADEEPFWNRIRNALPRFCRREAP